MFFFDKLGISLVIQNLECKTWYISAKHGLTKKKKKKKKTDRKPGITIAKPGLTEKPGMSIAKPGLTEKPSITIAKPGFTVKLVVSQVKFGKPGFTKLFFSSNSGSKPNANYTDRQK